MTHTPDTPLDPVDALIRLGGVATWPELRALTSRRKLRTAVSAGRVIELTRPYYALPETDQALAAAIRLGGTVSHLSAAQRWGWKVKTPPALPTITVPRWRHHLDPDGVEVHWGNLAPDAVQGRVTSPVQTVVDCARTYSFDEALAVADSALRGGVDHDSLLDAAKASPRTGRRKAMEVVEAADGRAANPFESVLRGIAKRVPGLEVEPQQWVGDVGRADLMDRRLGLVIEAESFEFHADSASFGRDVRRYTLFVRSGFIVVRFTWKDVMLDPDYVRAVLADLVAQGPYGRAVRCPSCAAAA
ncbi:hypothetical protein [Nocardioides koreensis]